MASERSDPIYPYRLFTLSRANEAVAAVAALTATVRRRLDDLRPASREDAGEAAELERAIRAALSEWESEILRLGAEPKGMFTVDFRSPDPNVLWCWTVDETEITHRHFTWESFKDRIPIEPHRCGWPSVN